MAASANPQPEGARQNNSTSAASNGAGHRNPNNSQATATENSNSGVSNALKHDISISVDWTADEQTILDEGLTKYASESNIVRYAKIAMQLKDKTVRDVAMRCKWMLRKESGRRRKLEDHNPSRKGKDKKEKGSDNSTKPSQLAAMPNVPQYAAPALPMDNDDGISYNDIGGVTGQLLQQNAQSFNDIATNLHKFQIQQNVSLFCQVRDNIAAILNDLDNVPDVMKQMPPLPTNVNEELADAILPRSIPRQ